MDDSMQAAADARFDRALEERGVRDPREFYRNRLRALKASNPEAYQKGVEYYRDTLIPSIAGGEADPVTAWLVYGQRLAQLEAPGEAVEIDQTGRSHSVGDTPDPSRLVLHLPSARGARAIVIGLPAELSRAQRATYDLLVAGKRE